MAGASDKHGKASKAGRNYRINGENRGPSPTQAATTKYVRSGGPQRMAKRKARNHGCGKPSLHLKPADQAHAHATTVSITKAA
jgi:hypothetical protein